MQLVMKILILTVTAGNGHNACARSMKNKLESLSDAEVKVVDILKEYSNKTNTWVADRGYCLSVARFQPLYNAFYEKYYKRAPWKRYSCPSQDTVLSLVTGLLNEILTFKPDVIYSTHFYGAMALTDIKLCYDLPCTTIVSNLDYVNSPFWEACVGVDYFAIPNEDFIDECVYEGFDKSQLLPLGLPVDERTLEVKDKAEERRRFGLEENVFTVMLMFGGGYWSGGLRIFKRLVKALKGRKAQIIVINGKNEKGYKKISEMHFDENLKVLNVGFTSEVPSYMSCADVLINKFGGTSCTEALNKRLPMLITEKIAAQERHNLVYMRKKGVVLSFKNGKELEEKILHLMDDPDTLKRMSAAIEPLVKPAISDLAKFILSRPESNYDDIPSKNIDMPQVKKTVKAALKKADKKARKEKK